MGLQDFQNGLIMGLSASGKSILDRGKPLQTPPYKDQFKTGKKIECSANRVWVTSSGKPYFYTSNYYTGKKIEDTNYSKAEPAYITSYSTKELAETSLEYRTKLGDTIFAFVYYSKLPAASTKGYALDETQWELVHSTAARQIDGIEYYVDVFVSNIKGNGTKQNIKINNINCPSLTVNIIDYFGYKSDKDKIISRKLDMEKYGKSPIEVYKDTNNPIIWIAWNEVSTGSRYTLVDENDIGSVFLSSYENQEDAIYIDEDKAGWRYFRFSNNADLNISAIELQ